MTQTTTQLNRSDATPLYIQLKNIVREKISSGEWQPNQMIPSENELGKLYGISRMTVRSVISQFVAEGTLYRIMGKGTFVSEPKYEIIGLQYGGLRKQLEQMGHKVSTQLLSIEKHPCNAYVAQKLNIRPGDEIYQIDRLRSANGTSISYHQSYIPSVLCHELETKNLESMQLCQILSEDYLLTQSKAVETIESYSADAPIADHLNVATGFPLILLQDQLTTSDGTIFEYTRVYFRGDKIKLRIEYNGQST